MAESKHGVGGGRYQAGPLDRISAAWKLSASVMLLLVVVLLPRGGFSALMLVAGLVVALCFYSRIAWRPTLKRLMLMEPFVLGIAGLLLFQPGGGKLFLVVMLKTNVCLLITQILAQTTSFTKLIQVLQKLGIPWIFVTTLTLMCRYIYVLGEESARMKRGRASRSFTQGKKIQWKTLSSVAGQLFVRASERAERIYNAMCARGWK